MDVGRERCDHIEKSAKNPSLFLKMTKGKSVESLALQAFTARKIRTAAI